MAMSHNSELQTTLGHRIMPLKFARCAMKSCLWFNMINGLIKYQTIILKLKIFVIENYTILFVRISFVCSKELQYSYDLFSC